LAGLWHYSVRCTSPRGLARGTRFGPYSGRVVSITEIKFSDDNSFMWEVCLSVCLFLFLSVYFSLSISFFRLFVYSSMLYCLCCLFRKGICSKNSSLIFAPIEGVPVGYIFTCVCLSVSLFVRLSVCLLDYSQSYKRILMKFFCA